jgi:hypothetical protein
MTHKELAEIIFKNKSVMNGYEPFATDEELIDYYAGMIEQHCIEQKLNKHGVSGKRQLIEKILFDYMENTKTYNETVNRILAACVNGVMDTVAERRLLPHQVYCSDCGYVMPKSYFKIHNCAELREGQP